MLHLYQLKWRTVYDPHAKEEYTKCGRWLPRDKVTVDIGTVACKTCLKTALATAKEQQREQMEIVTYYGQEIDCIEAQLKAVQGVA
jgi:hypothetical protein